MYSSAKIATDETNMYIYFFHRSRKRFIASDVTRCFLHFLVSPLILHVWISACICFCIYRFLHFFFSVFRSFCISICLPPYPLHLLCISAFLHFCIARLLQFWICSRMLRCVYFCISMSFCRDLSESVGVNPSGESGQESLNEARSDKSLAMFLAKATCNFN